MQKKSTGQFIVYSLEPKFYWSALPMLLAAAADMTFDQFLALQQREKSRMMDIIIKRVEINNETGAKRLAAVLAQLMVELHSYLDVPLETMRNNSKFIFEEAADIVDYIIDQTTSPPEGPRLVEPAKEEEP